MDELLVITDTEYLVLQGDGALELLDATEPAELLEVAQQGPPGPPGASGIASAPLFFAFGDASPRTLFTMPAAMLVLGVSIAVTTPFNGAPPSLQIGIAGQPDLLVAPAQVDLSIAASFALTPDVVVAASQPVILTLSPGAGVTQGAGRIVFEQIPTT